MRTDDLVERASDLFRLESAPEHLRCEEADRDRERACGEDLKHAQAIVVDRYVEVRAIERNPPRPSRQLPRPIDEVAPDALHGGSRRGLRRGDDGWLWGFGRA